MHPATREMLKYFRFDHLKSPMYEISEQFANLAQLMAQELPQNPETTVCLRKLLEAKDCAVRSILEVANLDS